MLVLVDGCLSPGGAPSSISETGATTEGGSSTQGMSSTSAAATTHEATSSGDARTTTEASTSTGECTFLCETDGDLESCNPFAQDCPEGYKCTAWDAFGDSPWYNGTKCFPLPRNPKQPGEPCTVDGYLSGIDDCAEGAICLDVDHDTRTGTCRALCSGGWDACAIDPASCCPEDQICTFNRVFGVCLDYCHPIAKPCPAGEVCAPVAELFQCIQDGSGDMGAIGDPCEFIDACDPGTFCGTPALFPGCDPKAGGCCIPFCDLNAPECPEGTACEPWWYDPMYTPDGFEDLGACVIPE